VQAGFIVPVFVITIGSTRFSQVDRNRLKIAEGSQHKAGQSRDGILIVDTALLREKI